MISTDRKASIRQASPTGPSAQKYKNLSPISFGRVMATGIVSLAAHLLAMPVIADTVFRLNTVIYGVLWLLTMVRLLYYPRCFLVTHSSLEGSAQSIRHPFR